MLLGVEGHRIHYDLLGPAAAPVVCFTHSLSLDGGMWAEQVPPLLAAGWRVLRVDARGHGGSDAAAGDYTIAALAGDVVRVLDFLGLERVHLVGLSMGGMIGQQLAVEHGRRLRSLMLCDTAPATPPAGAAGWPGRVATVRAAGSLEPLADATMGRMLTEAFKARNPRRWAQLRSTVASTRPDGYIGCAAAIMAFDIAGKLPAVRVPTLVVCGDDDEGTPPAGNRQIAALIPQGRYIGIPNARHLPNVEFPERFNEIMTGWLGENG